MKKPWSFSEYYSIVVKGNIPSGEQRETVEMLLFGFDKTKGLSDTQASRYVKGRPINHDYVEAIKDTPITELTDRIANHINLLDIARSADHVIDIISSDKYDISSAFAQKCKKLYDDGKFSELLAITFQYSVITPNTNTSTSFETYYKNVRKTYDKMKTLLYASKERPVKDFYVCNSIRQAKDIFIEVEKSEQDEQRTSDTINDPSLKKLRQQAPYILLTGEAGIGKSMLMRHFLLQAATDKEEKCNLTILVKLREYKVESSGLWDLIVHDVKSLDSSITEEIIHKTLKKGKATLLLDGVDEIQEKETNNFITEVNSIIADFPNCQFVLSSRRYSSFIEMSWVSIYEILPFSKDQAIEYIRRLDYLPEVPKQKESFLDRLTNEYYETHKDFAANPLLLTLMLLTFERFASLPSKKYLFYEEAYLTLLQGHDAKNKPGYRRIFQCVDDPSEFTPLFREFCAHSYFDSRFEFDKRGLEQYFDDLEPVKAIANPHSSEIKLNSKLTFPHFLTDVIKNVNLMFEAGGKYLFQHRSFQEYFFADYYSRADDARVWRLGNHLQEKFHSSFDNNEALDILFELSKEKVERFVFLPYLSDLFSKGSAEESYFYFLTEMINTLFFFVFRRKAIDAIIEQYSDVEVVLPKLGHELSDTNTTVLYWIIKSNGRSKTYNLFEDNFDESILYSGMPSLPLFGAIHNSATGGKVTLNVGSNLEAISGRYDPTIDLRDSNNQRIVFGEICQIPMVDILNKPDKYSELVRRLQAPDFPLRKTFKWLQSYYESIKERYALAEKRDASF